MKNLVIKTVIMTFTVIVTVIAVIYACVAIFSPKTLAKFWENTGNYSVSVKYYEKQYEKTGDISDLADLCAKLDVKSDSRKAVKYLAIFTGGENFSAFCQGAGKTGYKMTAYEYYYGAYTVAGYYEIGTTYAVNIAKRAVSAGYTENNAFFILLSEAEGLTAADGNLIETEISEIKETLSDGDGFAERDIQIARSIQ